MDRQEFLESYGSVEDYFYNSDADYYDLYDDEFNGQYNTNGDINGDTLFWKNLSLYELCIQCVLPVVWSAFNILAINVILCIFFIVCNKIKIFKESVLHIICAVCGVLPLIYHEKMHLYELLLQVLLFPVFCYVMSVLCILYLKRHSAIVFSTIILLALFYRECYLNIISWQTTKSVHMLMSMKSMAILFDIKSNELNMFPSFLQYAGYMLCAGNIIFGPFLTFQEYKNTFLFPVKWNKPKFVRLLWKIIMCLVCFVLSMCVVDWLLNRNVFTTENSDSVTNIFLNMYKQALKFRMSHYFICYVSAVFAMICGYRLENNSEILITKPMAIEWPQSLLNVVVYWNSPIHFWLKKYVFDEILKYINKENKIIAIVITYMISSLLHGLEVRLSAVLISLAGYTFVEHKMRTKLATRFPKSFSSSKHKYHCDSKKYLITLNQHTLLSQFINILFTILNIIHLAYLGSIMNISIKQSDNIEYQDAFESWRRVYFFSHILMFLMYIVSIML